MPWAMSRNSASADVALAMAVSSNARLMRLGGLGAGEPQFNR